MSDNETILRLVAENFALKDQLAEKEKTIAYWYGEYNKISDQYRLQSNTTESNDDIPFSAGKEAEKNLPLTTTGLKNECGMTLGVSASD